MCTQVRLAERSVEGRHSRIHRIQERAPASSVGYLSLEMRFIELQKLSSSNPEAALMQSDVDFVSSFLLGALHCNFPYRALHVMGQSQDAL